MLNGIITRHTIDKTTVGSLAYRWECLLYGFIHARDRALVEAISRIFVKDNQTLDVVVVKVFFSIGFGGGHVIT
jgi:hypothetical protein